MFTRSRLIGAVLSVLLAATMLVITASPASAGRDISMVEFGTHIDTNLTYGESLVVRGSVTDTSQSCTGILLDCDRPTGFVTIYAAIGLSETRVVGSAPVHPVTGERDFSSWGPITIPGLPVDTGFVSAFYSGDNEFRPHTQDLDVEIVPRPCTLSISQSSDTTAIGAPVTFTSTQSNGVPGTIRFRNAANQVFAGSLTEGVATAGFTTSSLPLGATDVHARWTGDINNSPCQSTPVTHTVTPPAPPDAGDDFRTVAVGVSTDLFVRSNDFTATGQPLELSVVTDPTLGVVQEDIDGEIFYRPNPGVVSGTDSFVYAATDVYGQSDTATVTLDISCASVAAVDDYLVLHDTVLTVADASGVLANDANCTGATPTVTDQPDHGTLLFGAGGGFTYTPAAGFVGRDSFMYSLGDAPGALSAEVRIFVHALPCHPVPVDDAYTVAFETALTVAAPGVRGNESNCGRPVVPIEDPQHGSLGLDALGSFTYTPEAGYSGPDSFKYHYVEDDPDAIGSVAITVLPPCVADLADDAYDVDFETALAVAAPGVRGNDDDCERDAAVVTDPDHGAVDLDAAGGFAYTPDAGYSGPDAFTYAVDESGETATVALTVAEEPCEPVLADDSFEAVSGVPLEVAAPGVSGNDTDDCGLTLAVADPPDHGRVGLDPSGGLLYFPDEGYVGPDSFTYGVDDGSPEAPAPEGDAVAPAAVIGAATVTFQVVPQLPPLEDETGTTTDPPAAGPNSPGSGSVGDGTDGSSGGALPRTGSDPWGPTLLAAVLVAVGTALLVVARRSAVSRPR